VEVTLMNYPSTPPEARDVEFARRLAIADLADYRRCLREYGPKHPVTKAAREAAEASNRYAIEIEARFRGKR
jgi:hypothetical protein